MDLEENKISNSRMVMIIPKHKDILIKKEANNIISRINKEIMNMSKIIKAKAEGLIFIKEDSNIIEEEEETTEFKINMKMNIIGKSKIRNTMESKNIVMKIIIQMDKQIELEEDTKAEIIKKLTIILFIGIIF